MDLTASVRRLADRRPGRTEADVQSDLHVLLTAPPLQLQDGAREIELRVGASSPPTPWTSPNSPPGTPSTATTPA